MSSNVNGIITWLRQWLDDIYAFKGQSLTIDEVYPVGAIYMTLDSANPSLIFGGTWERIDNRFLLGSENGQGTGTTGGSADAVVVSHNHTQKSHNHTQNAHNHTQAGHSHGTGDSSANKFLISNANIAVNGTKRSMPSTGNAAYFVYSPDSNAGIDEKTSTDSKTPTINDKTATNQATTAENNATGVDGTGKNMPPYLIVNIWKRTA